MVENDEAGVVLQELDVHPQNFDLVHHLQVKADLVALLEAVRLRTPQLQPQIIVPELSEVVLDGPVKLRPQLCALVLSLDCWVALGLFLLLWMITVAAGLIGEDERFSKAYFWFEAPSGCM